MVEIRNTRTTKSIFSALLIAAATIGTGALLFFVSISNTSAKDQQGESSSSSASQGRRGLQSLNFFTRFTDPKSIATRVRGGGALHGCAPRHTSGSAGCNPFTSANAPKYNVLYLLLDQWHPDWDGHTPERPTGPLPLRLPFLEKLAARGVRFTQAYVPSPYCGPSRACVASGKEYDATGVMKNGQWKVGFTTVYKLLRDVAGYHTMTVGKDDLYENDPNLPVYANAHNMRYATFDVGFSDAVRTKGKVRTAKERDAEPYADFLHTKNVTMMDGTVISAMQAFAACMMMHGEEAWEEGCDATAFTQEIYPDDFIRDQALELLNRKPGDKPWHLLVNFAGPHHPIVSTAKMAESVMDRTWPPPMNPESDDSCFCPQQKRAALYGPPAVQQPEIGGNCNVAAEIENIDKLMASIVQRVEEMGELDNTIVIVAGDHGDMRGDNKSTGKGMPWRGSVTTPLIISGPWMLKGAVHEGPVTTLDLGGTWLDYAGVGFKDRAPGMTTTSLRSILVGDQMSPRRPYVSTGYKEWRAVIRELPTSPLDLTPTSYKLICCKGVERGLDPNGKMMYGGCNYGAPPTASIYPLYSPFILRLYDTIRDPNELMPLEHARPDVIEELVPLLPEGWCGSDGSMGEPLVYSQPIG